MKLLMLRSFYTIAVPTICAVLIVQKNATDHTSQTKAYE